MAEAAFKQGQDVLANINKANKEMNSLIDATRVVLYDQAEQIRDMHERNKEEEYADLGGILPMGSDAEVVSVMDNKHYRKALKHTLIQMPTKPTVKQYGKSIMTLLFTDEYLRTRYFPYNRLVSH